MATEIKVPDMGESIIEATVSRWLKQVGDTVKPGEPLVELETDKINLEVGSQQTGVLQQIERQAGETVVVGDVLGRVEAQAGGDGQPAQTPQPAAQPEKAAPQAEAQQPPSPAVPEPAPPAPEPLPSAGRATPLAQRMAQELGVDLARVRPSGSGGQITKEDVQAFIDQRGAQPAPAVEIAPAPQTPSAPAASAPAQPAAEPGREKRQRMSRRRQTIARRLVEAQQTAAMLTTFNEIDMSRVMELRKRRREDFKERFGVDLGLMSFFIKASVGALKAFPMVNAEIQGDEVVYKQYYDIGIAVGAEEGLVVPVIRDADRMSFAEIESAVRDLAQKSRDNSLSLEDLRGGTFTITNGGIYGSLLSTPILNPPQVGILGMHRIQERPVAVNKEVVIRPMMYVALSYDHRLVDGREAVQFLVRVKEMVEDPERLLLG